MFNVYIYIYIIIYLTLYFGAVKMHQSSTSIYIIYISDRKVNNFQYFFNNLTKQKQK